MNNGKEGKEATATLIAHSGAEKVNRQELALVHTPERTASHVPIPHIELVESLDKVLHRNGLRIEQEEFAVQTEGLKMFATFKLAYEVTGNRPATEGYRFALGLRTSNNKTFPVQMVAGANVFVCDNLAFHGSMVTLKRKHTSQIDIMHELTGAVQTAMGQFKLIREGVDRLRDTIIGDVDAKAIIFDAAIKGVMPLRLIPGVAKNYFTPPHEEFRERTMWSLHNAFTETFKELKPAPMQEAAMGLGELMGF